MFLCLYINNLIKQVKIFKIITNFQIVMISFNVTTFFDGKVFLTTVNCINRI